MAWTLPSARKIPRNLGVINGRLTDCPNKPNCVSSQSTDPDKFIEPLPYQGSRDDARNKLLSIINADKRTQIRTSTEDYIHVEYKAMIFIDDVEFYLPAQVSVIHLRSASRLGYADFGANLRRIKAISAAFTSQV